MTALFSKQTALHWFDLTFGRDLDLDDVRRFVTSIVSDHRLGTVVFEAEGRSGTVRYRVGCERSGAIQGLRAALPDLVVSESKRQFPSDGTATVLRINTKRRALRCDDAEGAAARLLGALATRNAVVVTQLVVGGRNRPNAVPNRIEGMYSESWSRSLVEAATIGTPKVDTEVRRALALKHGLPGASVTVRVGSVGRNARSAVAAVEGAIRSLESPGLRVRLVKDKWANVLDAQSSRHAVPLNSDEIVSLLGWPVGERKYVGLDREGPRLIVPSQTERAERVIGRSDHPARQISIGQSAADGLRHTHVIGPTGVGKSTLLLNMALQDIEAGRGVVLLDPKGDLVDDIIARVRAPHLQRVVVLDPARSDHVVGFNPLSARNHELAVDGILHVFKQLYASSWGPRTQDILHSALLTLAGTDFASIVHVPQLLVDARFRRGVLAYRNHNETLRFFWHWYDNLSEAERSGVIAPVMNKIRPFLLRTSLRTMLGQRQPRFDPMTIFAERRVLLVPLRKGLIGAEAANRLGSLVIGQLWQLTQARSSIEQRRRHPVFAYLDEFQDYLHLPTDFADVLAQARGLGLGLVLAHQHLGQLTPNIRDSVLANAQSRIAFRLGQEDAARLARGSALEAEDFAHLGRYQIYASILDNGERTPFASASTTPARRKLRDSSVAGGALARRWGVSPADVDRAISVDRIGDGGDEDLGRRKRGSA